MARSKGAVLKYGVDGEEDGSRYDIEEREGARLKSKLKNERRQRRGRMDRGRKRKDG